MIFRRSIADDAKAFYKEQGQYAVAWLCIYITAKKALKSLAVNDPKYTILIDNDELTEVAAMLVMNFLTADKVVSPNEKTKLLSKSIINDIPIWANDLMTNDQELCELVVQTLRMNAVFQAVMTNSTTWLSDNPTGQKVAKILADHGGSVPEGVTPKIYRKLLKKWMSKG